DFPKSHWDWCPEVAEPSWPCAGSDLAVRPTSYSPDDASPPKRPTPWASSTGSSPPAAHEQRRSRSRSRSRRTPPWPPAPPSEPCAMAGVWTTRQRWTSRTPPGEPPRSRQTERKASPRSTRIGRRSGRADREIAAGHAPWVSVRGLSSPSLRRRWATAHRHKRSAKVSALVDALAGDARQQRADLALAV